MKIAVDRKALEKNKRIPDPKNHLPPIIVIHDSGTITHHKHLRVDYGTKIVYSPSDPLIINIDGEETEFTVWIEA